MEKQSPPQFELNSDERCLCRGDSKLPLTPTVYRFLTLLISNRGSLLRNEHILDYVWPNTYVTESLVRDYIRKIRNLLEDNSAKPEYIETVRGHGYRFLGGIELAGNNQTSAESVLQSSVLRPTIAVLAFDNLATDDRWDRFALGISDEIITDLSRYADIAVIARNSSFCYRGRVADVRQIGRELKARYILEGSIQISNNTLRVIANLVDSESGVSIWANRFDGKLGSLFQVKNDIVDFVASALGSYGGEIQRAEHKRLLRKSPSSLEAYELYLLGFEFDNQFGYKNTLKAIEALEKSVTLDPHFARSWIALNWACIHVAVSGYTDEYDHWIRRATECVHQAAKLDPHDPIVLIEQAFVSAAQQETKFANQLIEQALKLGHNNTDVLNLTANIIATVRGKPQHAMRLLERSFQLNPRPANGYHMALARVSYFASEFEKTISSCKYVSQYTPAKILNILAHAQLGADVELRRLVFEFKQLRLKFDPETTIRDFPITDPNAIELYRSGIRKAQLHCSV